MDNPVRAMTILAAVTALALGGCATAPEATTGGRGAPSLVAAPEHLIRDAAAYDTFMHGAISISPNFTGPGAVAQAVVRARAYNPGALVRGAVAYGAIAALQDRLFVGALHDSGRTPQQRRQLITAIQANPAVLYRLAGARSAAGRVTQALGSDGQRLSLTGAAVLRSAYSLQKLAWSQSQVANPRTRLAAAESAAAMPMYADPVRLAQLRRGDGAMASGRGGGVSPPYAPLIARALQVAALVALGDANPDRPLGLAAGARETDCLHLAKLNFHQCLAVAGPNYEDIFCTGRHALQDTGRCLAKAAGVSPG